MRENFGKKNKWMDACDDVEIKNKKKNINIDWHAYLLHFGQEQVWRAQAGGDEGAALPNQAAFRLLLFLPLAFSLLLVAVFGPGRPEGEQFGPFGLVRRRRCRCRRLGRQLPLLPRGFGFRRFLRGTQR